MYRRWHLSALVALACACPPLQGQAASAPSAEAVALAREFLSSSSAEAKQALARRLDALACDPEAVVLALRPKPPAEFQAGYFQREPFRTPHLLAKYPDARLYYIVPDSYRPDEPSGLIVMMHGGGADPLEGTQRAPARYMAAHPKGPGLGTPFSQSGMIVVAPCALYREKNSARWCLPEADDYLRDVVIEFQGHYNIDPNRVVLMGYSMGGYGAYHQVQRQPDRFAVVLAGAGGWRLAYWPVIRGTPLWIVHGAQDAHPQKRTMHTTDVAYARLAHELLTQHGIEHEYREHPGGHSRKEAFADLSHFIARMASVRRDPYCPRVADVSRRGWTSNSRYPAKHNRWLSIEEEVKAKLAYDSVQLDVPPSHKQLSKAEQFLAWKVKVAPLLRWGAVVDAANRGDNRFEVTTQHVRRFAIWLHPKMVDFRRPVRVTVNGALAFDRVVEPCISTALRSYERRQDWGLIYTAEVEITVPDTARAKPSARPAR